MKPTIPTALAAAVGTHAPQHLGQVYVALRERAADPVWWRGQEEFMGGAPVLTLGLAEAILDGSWFHSFDRVAELIATGNAEPDALLFVAAKAKQVTLLRALAISPLAPAVLDDKQRRRLYLANDAETRLNVLANPGFSAEERYQAALGRNRKGRYVLTAGQLWNAHTVPFEADVLDRLIDETEWLGAYTMALAYGRGDVYLRALGKAIDRLRAGLGALARYTVDTHVLRQGVVPSLMDSDVFAQLQRILVGDPLLYDRRGGRSFQALFDETIGVRTGRRQLDLDRLGELVRAFHDGDLPDDRYFWPARVGVERAVLRMIPDDQRLEWIHKVRDRRPARFHPESYVGLVKVDCETAKSLYGVKAFVETFGVEAFVEAVAPVAATEQFSLLVLDWPGSVSDLVEVLS